MRTRLTMFLYAAAVSAALGQQANPAPSDAATQPADWVSTLSQLPRNEAEFNERLSRVQARIDELAGELGPASQPATQPADIPADPNVANAQARLFAWREYRARLSTAAQLTRTLQELRSDVVVQRIGDETKQYQALANELVARSVPDEVTEDQIDEAMAEVQRLQARLTSLTELQAQRRRVLDEGLEQRRQELEERVRALRGGPAEVTPTPEGGPVPAADASAPSDPNAPAPVEGSNETGPPSPEPVLTPDPMRERLSAIRLGALQIGLQTLAIERQATELALALDRPLVTVTQEALGAAQAWLTRLSDARSRQQLAELERVRATDLPPARQALVDYKLIIERVTLRYFSDRDFLQRVQEHTSAPLEAQLEQRLAAAREGWRRVLEGADFQGARELTLIYRDLQVAIREGEAALAERVERHTSITAHVRRLQQVRERALELVEQQAAQVRLRSDELETAARAEIETELSRAGSEFRAVMGRAITPMSEAAAISAAMLQLHEAHLEALEALETELYWERLTALGSGILHTDWSGAVSELGLLYHTFAATDQQDGPDPNDIESVLFAERSATRDRLRQFAATARDELQGFVGVAGLYTLGGGVISLGIGLLMMGWLRRQSAPLAREIAERAAASRAENEEPHPPAHDLADRIHLQTLNLLGDIVVPLSIAIVLAAACVLVLDERLVRQYALLVIALLMSAITAVRLVHHVFEAKRPPHRLMDTSDDVAAHWRWWLVGLIAFSAIMWTGPIALTLADVAPALRQALVEVFKTGLLVLLLLFLARKHLVLGLAQRGSSLFSVAVTVAYPIALLGVSGLLVLELLGYGVLVTRVMVGASLTLAIVLGVFLTFEYVLDLLRPGVEPDEPDEGAEEDDEDVQPRSYVAGMIAAAARFAAFALVIYLVLRVWRVPLPDVSVQSLSAIATVIVVSIVVDRLIAAALDALAMQGRLPRTTGRIVGRWIRGLIFAVAALQIANLLGQDTAWIRTFLVTVLGLVAIGFVAVWSILSNILATFVILIFRPFDMGEQIEIEPDNIKGRVIDINFMYTTLRNEEGRKIAVPNNMFAQKYINRRPLRGAPQRTLAEQLDKEATA